MDKNDLIFETSILGSKFSIFEDRIVYTLLFKKQVIPMHHITSVEDPMPGLQQIKIETKGGKIFKPVIRLKDKQKAVNLIIRQI